MNEPATNKYSIAFFAHSNDAESAKRISDKFLYETPYFENIQRTFYLDQTDQIARREIAEDLAEFDAVILFLTKESLSINEIIVETLRLLNDTDLDIFPIMLDHSDWKKFPFEELNPQMYPLIRTPLSLNSSAGEFYLDIGLRDVAEEIADILDRKNRSSASTQQTEIPDSQTKKIDKTQKSASSKQEPINYDEIPDSDPLIKEALEFEKSNQTDRFEKKFKDADEDKTIPLEQLSDFNLSDTARRIMEMAIQIMKTGSESHLLSTGFLFFSIVELGSQTKTRYGTAKLIAETIDNLNRQGYASFRNIYQIDWIELNREEYKINILDNELMSSVLFEILKNAKEIVEKIGRNQIHTRQIFAALLNAHTADEEQKTGFQKLLEALEIPFDDLQKSFLDYCKKRDSENADVWEQILSGETLADQKLNLLAGYHSDGQEGGDDLLGIDDDVNAFATLIASHTIKPPLSIGLFGQWGSGKTFFMRRLRKRINYLAGIAQKSGKRQKEIPFYKRIAQIEFNAWHYVEGDLWASLVEHIFRNLSIDEAEENEVNKLRENLLEELAVEKAAKTLAQTELDNAIANLETVEEDLKTAKEKLEENTKKLENIKVPDILAGIKFKELDSSVQTDINKILKELKIDEVGQETNSFIASIAEARTVLESGNAFITPLIKGKNKGKRIAFLLICIGAAPLLSFLLNFLLNYFDVKNPTGITTVSGIATLLATITAWISTQSKWLSNWLSKAEQAQQKIDDLVAEKEAETKADITRLEKEFEVSNSEYKVALQANEDATQRVAKAEAKLEEVTALKFLAKFIQDRADSDDYRKHLGILALVRNDFERLSNYIEADNRRLVPNPKKPEEVKKAYKNIEAENIDTDKRINRIVLYIDDLDRCPPNKVVDVLQAVHLLLAFPLFVVVVGVDARWITRSLESRYRELLHSSSNAGNNRSSSKTENGESSSNKENGESDMQLIGSATPDDYLEKIFQIPFWLNPMDEKASEKMVEGLIGDSIIPDKIIPDPNSDEKEPDKPYVISPQSTPDKKIVTDHPSDLATVKDSEAVQKKVETKEQKTETPKPKSPTDEELLDQNNLEIYDEEYKFVNKLAPLLGRSPRSLKRFVNIYRLIKAGLSQKELDTFSKFENDLKDYQVVLFLLAVDTGFPKISKEFFQIFHNYKVKREYKSTDKKDKKVEDESFYDFKIFFRTIINDNSIDYLKIQKWLEPEWETWGTKESIEKIDEWIPCVLRYSFQSKIKY